LDGRLRSRGGDTAAFAVPLLSLTSVSGEALILMRCAFLLLQPFSRAHLPILGRIKDGSW